MRAPSATTNVRLLFAALAFACALAVSAPLFARAQTPPPATNEEVAAAASDEDIANSQTLSQGGIFGCLGQGARVVAANVGTTRAVGGVYVPVNDAAVTLNTGFLVYKECILDGMARRIAQSGTAELGQQALRQLQQGRGGTAQYVVNPNEELRERQSAIVASDLSEESLASMCQAFRQPVQRAIARGYLTSANSPGQVYACPTGFGSTGYTGWFATIQPSGNILGATGLVGDRIRRDFEADERNIRQMWDWGRGIVPIFDNNTNPLEQRVLTPGFLIADAISQMTGSGFRQLENASEIDQVVTSLFAGLTTRIIGSASGVPGLFASSGNQPAYMDQMVAQTQAAVRSGAVNAAVIALSNYRQAEAAYLEAKQGIATALINGIAQLRSYESQCWSLIIPAVQTYAQQNGNPTLTIATSTQFSQAVIDDPSNGIRELASTTAAQVTASQQALGQIDGLITQVTNTNSTQAQQQALLQIDQMIANNQLHTQQDAQTAADQRQTVTGALNTLLENTRTTWADSQDANIGWCNVNNPAVIERWFNAWRQ